VIAEIEAGEQGRPQVEPTARRGDTAHRSFPGRLDCRRAREYTVGAAIPVAKCEGAPFERRDSQPELGYSAGLRELACGRLTKTGPLAR
jgi:hypothetical protein